jgi:hypothetical protein
MALPHLFPSLIQGPIQAVLIAGTGLSAPHCPTVEVLKPKLDGVAKDLGVTPNGNFYELAEAVLESLIASGKSDSEGRLSLAENLGMLDDRCWFGDIGLPLSGNTPRHRVIARFVVEERLRAIVSLNWDALLECALDSVGLTETEAPLRPWKMTKYVRIVDKTHMPNLAQANVFPVIKPHGCVRALEEMRNQIRSGSAIGSVTFKLTANELNNITVDQQNVVNVNVKSYIAECPLIGIGWRATEDYLRSAIVEIAQQVQRNEPDSFTLIDLDWDSNHSDIAVAYGKKDDEAFVKVRKTHNPSTDCLFQWLQARHALVRMIEMIPTAEEPPLQKLLDEIDHPESDHPLLRWADCWLPIWVRLCWRVGAMRGVDPRTNQVIGPFDIPILPRDIHIPLTGMSVERRDLHAAAKLLSVLSTSLSRFRFDLFPGGIFETNRNRLYLPLPGWRADVPPADLAALKPLIESLKGLGYVKEIRLVWLNDKDEVVNSSIKRELEARFRRLMPLAGFARGKGVAWASLDEIVEVDDAGLA